MNLELNKTETVNEICKKVFDSIPTEIIRNEIGSAAYVYTVTVNGNNYVIKISDNRLLITGSTYWLKKLAFLNLPVPNVIAENVDEHISGVPFYFVMNCIPGKDLCVVYNELSAEHKKQIAKDLVF